MDGVQIILDLLSEDAAILALDPTPELTAGVLWDSVTLPALTVSRVSGVSRNIVKAGSTRRKTDRIQVTALGADYPSVKDLLALVVAACAEEIGDVAGASNVTVHYDSDGPDFMNEEASIYMQSVDFMVGYSETV